MKKRTSNRGFTLVELMIAIAILALVIAPLVANFIQSSKMNLKGRKSLNATNLAQDIMEGMSVYTADEVIELIEETEADSTGVRTLVGNILPNSATYGSITKISGDTDPVKKYQLNNVVTVAGARNEYDVKVTLNPTGSEHAAFNQQEYAAITEINQYYDAVYTHESNETESALDKFYTDSNHSEQKEAFRGKLKRTFIIDIADNGTAGYPQYEVSVKREYELLDLTLASKVGLDTQEKRIYTPAPTANISRMNPDQLPRSIYFYYEGIENASYNDVPRMDNIKINNTTGQEITVYLVRVQQAGTTNVSYGQNYGCAVEITSRFNGMDDYNVHVVSNLRYDLNAASMKQNFRTQDEDGVVFSKDDYPFNDSGVQYETSTYKRERATYTYNGSTVNETVYQSNFSDGFSREKKNALYKVNIEIYVKGTGERISTYNGGLSN